MSCSLIRQALQGLSLLNQKLGSRCWDGKRTWTNEALLKMQLLWVSSLLPLPLPCRAKYPSTQVPT